MMLEAYAVGVKLEMSSNVASVLDKLITDIGKFNDLVSASSKAVGRLATNLGELRGSGSATADLEKIGSAMRTAESASAGLTRTMRSTAEYAGETARFMRQAAEAAGRVRAPAGSGAGGHGSARFSDHNMLMGTMAAGAVSGAMTEALRHAMTPAIDLNRTTDVLAGDMRLSPDQVDAAVKRAWETTKLAPGSTAGGNLASMLDLKMVFGDLTEAQKLLPEFAKMTAMFSALDRKHGGSGEQAFAAAKALEVMAGMVDETTDASGNTVRSINPELGMQRLRAMQRVAGATNMRVTPSDYLGFAKQARVAGMTLTDEFTYEQLPALLGVLGGQRTGTALMSMSQVFKGGKLTAKSMAAMQEIGLAGEGGITREGGHRNRRGEMVGGHDVVHPEAIYDLALMGHNPLQYLEAAQKRMEAKGIHGSEAQIEALMRASQRSTIAGIFADILKDMPAILKEQQNIRNFRPDFAEHLAEVDPAAKVQQFSAALTNFATVMGTAGMSDAMAVLDRVTKGLNALSDLAQAHPDIARAMFDAAAGLGAIATVLTTVGTAILLWGPVFKMLGIGGAAGGSGATAGAAAGIGLGGAAALGGAAGVVGGAIALGGTTDPVEAERRLNLLRQQQRSGASLVPQDGGPEGRPLVPPTVAPTQPERHSDIYLDGAKVGKMIARRIAWSGQGPSRGASWYDPRMSPIGSIPA